MQRLQQFRAKQPFGPTHAALGAEVRRHQLKQDGARRVADRRRDNVRAAKRPAELLDNLCAETLRKALDGHGALLLSTG